MKLTQRFAYYFGGFSIGLILLMFFLSGKKTSCDYGLDARVLKNINSKPLVFSDEVKYIIQEKGIDTITINYVLQKGDINFTSDSRKKPCGIYSIEGRHNNKDIVLLVENCDSIVTLKDLKIEY